MHGHTSVGWLAKTYIHQLCVNTGGRKEDLPRAMVDKDGWEERVKFNDISTFLGYLIPNLSF